MNHRLSFLAVILIAAFFSPSPAAHAEDREGLRLVVQKATLGKEKERDSFNDWDKVESIMGLRLQLQNISMQDMPEGTVEWNVVVERWGHKPTLYHLISGTETLPALPKSRPHEMTVAAIKSTNYEISSNRKDFADEIKAWKLVIKQGDKERVFVSGSSFETLSKKAKAK